MNIYFIKIEKIWKRFYISKYNKLIIDIMN